MDDKEKGLEQDVDNYIAKPFHLAELNARIKSVLRRVKFDGKIELKIGKLRVINSRL